MRSVALIAAITALLSSAALSRAEADRPEQGSAPVSLTLQVADTGGIPAAGVSFARAVQRLSHGSLLIVVRTAAQQTADGELRLVREVEKGTAALAWLPTRAWDAVGRPTFAALQAPFLLTNYAVLKKVLQGAIGKGMLAGTRPAGVRTLGLAAVDLHVPLGARRPFRTVADFRGTTLRVPSSSALTTSILDALGARSASIASGPELYSALKSGTVDGAVSSLLYVFSNGYYTAAKYLTVNLAFFPYVGSVGINESAFESLSPSDRAVLVRAAAEMTRRSFAGIRGRDEGLLRILCQAGLEAATATPSQLAELRRAEQPVYAELEADALTARRIKMIQALKKKTKPTLPLSIPSGCAAA
jgi:TRAP-type C4-dicarboxylate transport system substrate-binding protein